MRLPKCTAFDLLRRHTWASTWPLMVIILGFAPSLSAQAKRTKQATMWRPAQLSPLQDYRLAVKERGSLAVTHIGNCGDSLAWVISGLSSSAKRVFFLSSDSVLARVADSLNAPRRKSLGNLREALALAAAASSDQHVVALRAMAHRSRQVILASANTAAACADCREGDDYESRLDLFTNWCDSTRDASIDGLITLAEQALESISEEYENARDSVSDRAENLLDKENEEREARADSIALEEEIASRLVISVGYDNPVSYRGRDNGVRLYSFSPSVQYTHRSGLFASVSGSWLDKSEGNWDDTEASVGFGRALGDAWFGSLAFAHLWFSSTSPQSKSVLDNSLDLEIDWSGTFLSTAAQLSYAFSKTSETTLSLSVAAPMMVFERPGGGSLLFEPGLTGIYGQQDLSLVAARKQKSKKNNLPAPAVKKAKVFGVMDYELDLPLKYRWGAYALGASYTVAVPLNVLDESTKTVFGVLSVELSVTIR